MCTRCVQSAPLRGSVAGLPRVLPGCRALLEISVYLGLFAAAFGAATLVPMQSEAVLGALLLAAQQPAWLLLLVATAGNVLGSLLNWLLGRGIQRWQHARWFPASATQLEQAKHTYRRYGHWSLLLSWVPLIGDPLTLVAGMLREPLWRFALLVTLAKGGRYLVLAATLTGFA